jgi:hypothetical protein
MTEIRFTTPVYPILIWFMKSYYHISRECQYAPQYISIMLENFTPKRLLLKPNLRPKPLPAYQLRML